MTINRLFSFVVAAPYRSVKMILFQIYNLVKRPGAYHLYYNDASPIIFSAIFRTDTLLIFLLKLCETDPQNSTLLYLN